MSPASELRYLDLTPMWKRYGRGDISPSGTGGGGGGTSSDPRDSLVYGSYIPGWTPNTVGVRTANWSSGASITFTDVFGDANGEIYLDFSTPQVRTNVNYMGKVICRGATTFTFNNCRFAGQIPEQCVTVNAGAIQNYGSSPPHLVFIDCTIDRQIWFDRGLSPYKGSPYQSGIHGGNFTMRRSDIKNCQDGVNFNGPNVLAAAIDHFVLIEASQIHKNYYKNGWFDQYAPWNGTVAGPGVPASRDTHSDAFQWNVGRNVTIRYSMLGGVSNAAAYALAPPNAYNAGDDSHNSALIIQQEAGTTDYMLVQNVLVEYNWLMAGAATLNMNYKNSNLGADWIFRFNKFAIRGTTAQAGAGYQIYKHGSLQSQLTGNVQWDPAGSINGNGVAASIVNYPGT